MRRADRLFEIIQILRRVRAPISAQSIADELEASKRTVYRDIATLMGQRVPIVGEPGIGYLLAAEFDMPSLMLTIEELEAVALGASWVQSRGEPDMARAAENVLAKILSAIPKRLWPYLVDPTTSVAPVPPIHEVISISDLRIAIRSGHKVEIIYEGKDANRTVRTVWPILVGYRDIGRILAAWCELRSGFRFFRTERIQSLRVLEQRFPERPVVLKKRWKLAMDLERQTYFSRANTDRPDLGYPAKER